MALLKKFSLGIKRVWCYLLGNLLVLLGKYDRKYLCGRHFHGDISGKLAVGWEWVVYDYINCRRANRNLDVPWPVSSQIAVVNPENIDFHPDDLNNFQGVGNYFQAQAKISIGKGTYIAFNTGFITANHDLIDPEKHMPPQAIRLGEQCWVGMNAMILPGVTLGEHTVVAAGAVVTRSFTEGWCVLAGVPAVKIKELRAENAEVRRETENG